MFLPRTAIVWGGGGRGRGVEVGRVGRCCGFFWCLLGPVPAASGGNWLVSDHFPLQPYFDWTTTWVTLSLCLTPLSISFKLNSSV